MSQDREEKSVAFMESSVKEFKIFVDTCSLLSENAVEFWRHITPILQREQKSIIVPLRVYDEVKKFADDPALCSRKSDPHLNERAKAVCNDIAKLQKAHVVEIFGDEHDNFADNVFQTVFTQFRLKYNLMLITQDHNLASDIVAIGKSKAVSTKNRIFVERINKYGYLSQFRFEETHASSGQQPSAASAFDQGKPIPLDECFAFADSVRQVAGSMVVTYVPGKGDSLTAERHGDCKTVKLTVEVSSGGEGTIFNTDIPGFVAKIYKPGKLDCARFEKLKLMMTKDINCEGVCFPVALLYNRKNEFVGYLMKQAKGRELQRCVFIPQLLKTTFPNWNKVDTVNLCITILKKLKYLHDRNIILGDINPNNILVESPSEVYFVDTDSYQIEGFPCPVGTINYTAPEIQRKEFSSFLRTMGNENFAVATLLFMIMLPGKPPYSLQGGENQIDNILNGDFAYASGNRSTGKAPEGMWRFCWSHLPYYLKNDFYETFRKDGKYYDEKKRYSTGDWLQKFEYYLGLLMSGKLKNQDEMSLELFPTRLKRNPKVTYIRCKICGNEVDEEWTEQGICNDCLQKGETYHCEKCGHEMIYKNYQKYIKNSQKYKICKDCYDKSQMIYMTAVCSECGQNFTITFGEKEFYEEKGYQLPKRCRHCRGRKTYGQNTQYDSSTSGPRNTRSSSGTGSSSGSSRGLCFITTAACEYFGKPDDCYELSALRCFRDGWLAQQPGGEALIQEYYQVAPTIVEKLNASENRGAIYRNIWEHYILPCVRLIEEGEYESCRVLYENMVHNLNQII